MLSLDCRLELQTVCRGYDRKTCWVQTRAAVLPPHGAVITSQKLRLTGSDIFYAIHSAHSDDFGRTWSGFTEQRAFRPRRRPDGAYFYVSDFWPKWHATTGVLLGTGHTPLYRDDELVSTPYPRSPAYSTYARDSRQWCDWRSLELPEDPFYNSGAGCAQRVDLSNGDVLLPIYFLSFEELSRGSRRRSSVAVLRCAFDGVALRYLEHGTILSVPAPRGLGEPSLAHWDNRFFLTLRNDERGYVTAGPDGIHFPPPVPWTFDDGEEIGNYNTQQHWIVHSDGLFLAYTRRGAGNDHVFRHRAPLFMARVDPDRLCLVRSSERVVVPERGARLGNFGTTSASPGESWVVVSEWMQTNPPNPFDSTVCERYGSDNSVFIARIHWDRPNRLAPRAP